MHSKGTQNDGQPTRQLLGRKGKDKASVVPGGLTTGCWVDVGLDGGGEQQRRKGSDDLWIEEQKKYKRKLSRAIRGSLGQLNKLLHEDMEKVRCGQRLQTPISKPWNFNFHLLSSSPYF